VREDISRRSTIILSWGRNYYYYYLKLPIPPGAQSIFVSLAPPAHAGIIQRGMKSKIYIVG